MRRRRDGVRALIRDVIDHDGSDAALEAELVEALAFSAALSPEASPPPRLKRRLLDSIARPQVAFFDRVARLLHVSLDDARLLLESFDRPDQRDRWAESGPGIWLQHLSPGPRFADAVVGLVRVEAGVTFPHHSHLGTEQVLVLQGGMRDVSGLISLPGDLVIMPPDSDHTFEALPGDELRYLAVVEGGVDFRPSGGPLLLPDGPR